MQRADARASLMDRYHELITAKLLGTLTQPGSLELDHITQQLDQQDAEAARALEEAGRKQQKAVDQALLRAQRLLQELK